MPFDTIVKCIVMQSGCITAEMNVDKKKNNNMQ